MKSEKGITLLSLIMYVILMTMAVSILAVVSRYFYKNTSYISDVGKYVSGFNKFNMYFIEDVKNNKSIHDIEDNKIVFEDGTQYTFANNTIYRNKVKLCNNIYSCSFRKRRKADENGRIKEIINVKLIIKGTEIFETENEYVLKYW